MFKIKKIKGVIKNNIVSNKKILAVFVGFFIILALIDFSCLGNTLQPLIPLHQNNNIPTSFDSNRNTESNSNKENFYAAIDQQGHRLSILNNNKQVEKQILFDLNNDELSQAEFVKVINSEIYIVGYMQDKSSYKYTETRLIKLSKSGDYIDLIKSYDVSGDNYRKISAVNIKDNKLQIITAQNSFVYLEELDLNNNNKEFKTVISFQMNSSLNVAYFASHLNKYVLIDSLDNAYFLTNDTAKQVNLTDCLDEIFDGKQYKIKYMPDSDTSYEFHIKNNSSQESIPINLNSDLLNINWDTNQILYAGATNNIFICFDMNTGTSEHYDFFFYTFLFAFIIILKWFSIITTSIIIIILIILWFIKLRKEEISKFWKIITGLFLLAVIILTSVFVCRYFYDDKTSDLQNKVIAIAKSFSDNHRIDLEELNHDSFNKSIVGENKVLDTKNKLDKFSKNFSNVSKNFYDVNQPISYCLYNFDKENKIFEQIDGYELQNSLWNTNQQFFNDQLSTIEERECISGSYQDSHDDVIYAIAPIYNNNGKLLCVISVNSSLSFLHEDYLASLISIIIMLIILANVIYLSINSFGTFKSSFKNLKEDKIKKFDFPEIHLTVPFEYLRNFTIALDSVLCVIVTKNMLATFNEQDNGVLLGIPLFATAFGAFLCIIIFPKIKNNLTIKSVYIVGAITTIISYSFIAVSVLNNNFWIFVLLKILAGIASGILYVASSTLPMCVNDKKIRFKAIREMSLSTISSSIIAVWISGFVADLFGAFSIYLLGTIVGVILLIISYFFIQPNNYFKNNKFSQKQKVDFKSAIRFFASPAIIAVILVCFAETTVGGYKTYLFPLYTSGLNISNTDISNYFIICSAVSFLISRWIDSRHIKIFDHWADTLILLILLGAIYLMFILNTTFIWAIATFLLSSTIAKYLSSEWKILWPRKSEYMGIDPTKFQFAFNAIEYSGITLRPIFLGILLNIGSSNVCAVLGLCILCIALIYFIFTRQTPIRFNK